MEAAAALIALTALSSAVCGAAPGAVAAARCLPSEACPESSQSQLVCLSQHNCTLPGGGQIIVDVEGDELRASCLRSPRLPAEADLPRLPSAAIYQAVFTNCHAGSGGFAGVLRAFGASPTNVHKLSSLNDVLSVDGAGLAEQLRGLPALESLEVQGWRGARLPATLQEMPALLFLFMNGHGLYGPALVLEVRSLALPVLRMLALTHVGLARLPAVALRPLARLTALHLAFNQLTEIEPTALAGLRALEHVNLSYNPGLRVPPRLLAGLPALRVVSLNGCHITQLPADMFEDSHALQILYLQGNNLTALPATLLRNQTKLHRLDLSENRIEAFTTEGTFSGLIGMTELSVAHNRIRTLCDDWRHMPNLTTLNLSHNEFTELTDSDFNFNSKLLTVDLRHNRIVTVHLEEESGRTGAVRQLTMARVLLDDNPLRCDCRLYELARRMRESIEVKLGSPACAAPPALARRPLRAVPLPEFTCELPAPACPAACACELQMGELHLTCDAVPAPAAWPAPPYRLPDGLLVPAATYYSLRLTRAPAYERLSLPVRVRTLNVSRLGLRAVPRVSPPSDLLDLRWNKLRVVAPRDNTTRLLLAGNELECDCDHADDVVDLQLHKDQVVDWKLLQCAHTSTVHPLWLAEINVTLCHLLPALERPERPAWLAWPAAAAVLVTAVLVTAVLVAGCWRWERELRILLGCCWRRDADDEEREYDVFVTYAYQDEAWVVDELLPRLEGGARPLRLCLHLRDWEVGDLISRQIHRSVERSRRTLVVLSDHYLRSTWATVEFRAAYLAETRERRARVVVVVLRPPTPALLDPLPELKAYLRTSTCVQVGAPFFWSVLRKALPPGRERAPPHPHPPLHPRDTRSEALPLRDVSCVHDASSASS